MTFNGKEGMGVRPSPGTRKYLLQRVFSSGILAV
jgi:hypothetical protein